jgi:hypothetical protein
MSEDEATQVQVDLAALSDGGPAETVCTVRLNDEASEELSAMTLAVDRCATALESCTATLARVAKELEDATAKAVALVGAGMVCECEDDGGGQDDDGERDG